MVFKRKTTVFDDSPHRLQKTLGLMLKILGPDRVLVIARELTKMHETFHRGTLPQIKTHFEKNAPRGEIVLLLAPKGF